MSYAPSDDASADKLLGVKRLSNRDITGQAPIDKAVFPGAHVTRACHSNGVYDSDPFQTCFSNLLAAGFRRLIIDVYWSGLNLQWQLCPASIPQLGNTTTSNVSARRRNTEEALHRRQTATTDTLPSVSSDSSKLPSNNTSSTVASNEAATSSTISSAASSQPTTSMGQSGTPLITLGPYSCSEGLSLDTITGLMNGYIDSTADPTAATLQILEFNLHSASSASDPGGPPQNVSAGDLPSTAQTVGQSFWQSLRTQMYLPGDLAAERANLNLSWYQVRAQERLPITGYFNVERSSGGTDSTDDGWPSELYLLLTRLNRVILAWGSVDSEMEEYNFDYDGQYIFPSGSLSKPRGLEQSDSGIVTSGCFYDSNGTSVAQVNNTWAIRTLNGSNLALLPDVMQNMTACGVTPILNATLSNENANDNFQPYKQYGESLLIGWAPGEPTNESSPGVNTDGPADQFRCAVLDSSSAYHGRWKVVNCQGSYRAACRAGVQPYNWRLSTDITSASDAPDACPEGSSFDVPVTQLENTYLYEHVLADAANASDPSEVSAVWINLNSLDSEGCWVTTGPNGTCRYKATAEEEHNRMVLIPTIAALIILILTVLTILVKCSVNRRNTRRHRIGPGGWEYEGVPS